MESQSNISKKVDLKETSDQSLQDQSDDTDRRRERFFNSRDVWNSTVWEKKMESNSRKKLSSGEGPWRPFTMLQNETKWIVICFSFFLFNEVVTVPTIFFIVYWFILSHVHPRNQSEIRATNLQSSIPSTLLSQKLAWKPKGTKKEGRKEGPSSFEENKMGRKWRRGSKANILPAVAANRQLLGFEHVLPPCCHDEPRLR